MAGLKRERRGLTNHQAPVTLLGEHKKVTQGDQTMSSVARVTEIIASSAKSFDDALDVGVARATKTLNGVTGAWVQDQKVIIEDGKIVEYRVNLKVTFVLED